MWPPPWGIQGTQLRSRAGAPQAWLACVLSQMQGRGGAGQAEADRKTLERLGGGAAGSAMAVASSSPQPLGACHPPAPWMPLRESPHHPWASQFHLLHLEWPRDRAGTSARQAPGWSVRTWGPVSTAAWAWCPRVLGLRLLLQLLDPGEAAPPAQHGLPGACRGARRQGQLGSRAGGSSLGALGKEPGGRVPAPQVAPLEEVSVQLTQGAQGVQDKAGQPLLAVAVLVLHRG